MVERTRLEGEGELETIYRICAAKDEIGTWQDVADILNGILGYEYTESKYRKQFQSFEKILDANQDKFVSDSSYLKEIQEQKRELEITKAQCRDERTAWSRQNTTQARVEQKLDYLGERLEEIGRMEFRDHAVPVNFFNDESDLLIILSDLHVGQIFESTWGRYNSDIAKHRLSKYLDSISGIQLRHKSRNAYVSIQGDLINGSIHKSIAITNRENVIDQVKLAVEYITSFCYELSNNFEHVYVTNVSGNHSRIDKKEDALHDERLDDLIGWMVKKLTSDVDNITIMNNVIDIGIATMNIRGKEYVAVHGDYDSFSKSGVSNLCMMLGHVPYAVTFGHLHTCSVDESGGVKMIRGGSLAGSGDAYTIEQRLKGKPSQMVCVCDDTGVVCYYPIELE